MSRKVGKERAGWCEERECIGGAMAEAVEMPRFRCRVCPFC